jgi:predicted DNA-binding transcriptional regulator YafY
LTEQEWNDPTFRAACRKYKELQNSSRSLKLIKSAQSVVDKFTDYFDSIDLTERDEITGKPIWKTKDIMAEMQSVSKVIEELKTLEFMYKKEQEAQSDTRGDIKEGFMDR